MVSIGETIRNNPPVNVEAAKQRIVAAIGSNNTERVRDMEQVGASITSIGYNMWGMWNTHIFRPLGTVVGLPVVSERAGETWYAYHCFSSTGYFITGCSLIAVGHLLYRSGGVLSLIPGLQELGAVVYVAGFAMAGLGVLWAAATTIDLSLKLMWMN